MTSLGFRPPQFSEDFAWLPTWLQNLQVEASATNNRIKETQTSTSQIEILSREEGGHNSCHLFLSGEDTSQYSVAPSPGNVLHLCLRLSSDGESLESQSQYLCASQPMHGSNKVPLLQQIETSAGSQEKAYLSKVNDNHVVVEASPLNSVPIAVGNVGQQSPTNNEEIGRQSVEKVDCSTDGEVKSDIPLAVEITGLSSSAKYRESGVREEKFNVRDIKNAEVSDAVELCIAASEALVIHELMRSGSAVEVFSTGNILEAALQIKKARLKGLEDGIFCSSEEIDEIDFLSDLDDSVMESAFQDVGLSFSDPDVQHACNSDMCQVKDTPLENHYRDLNGSTHVQLKAQDNVFDGSDLGLNTSKLASLADIVSYQPGEEVSHVSAEAQVDVNSSPACKSENAEREDRICSPSADTFKSRWFGGWMVKESDASANFKQNNTKGIPEFFNGETSFLSESAYAADENSCVQKHDSGSKIVYSSSIPFGDALDKAEEGILSSQEVRSSDQSLVDPLCSIVPCSISSENASVPLAQNQDDREADAQSCFNTESGLRLDNVQRMSNVNVNGYVDVDAVPTSTGVCLEAPVRMQLTSLKTYSTFLPKHDVILKAQRPYRTQQLSSEHVGEPLLLKQNVHSHSSSDRRNSKCFLPLRPEIKCSVDKDHEQNHGPTVIQSPVADHDEPAKDGAELPEQQVQPSVKTISPLILNRRKCCRLNPSEPVKAVPGMKNPVQIVSKRTVSKAFERKNVQMINSKLNNPPSPSNLVRKQVRFSELEVELNKDVQQPETSKKDCFAVRANKRSKNSKMWSDFQAQDAKSCLTGYTNVTKRPMFHGLEFLLTGFSSQKERDIVRLIQDYGGMVLMDVPCPPSISRANRRLKSNFQRLPIVLCSKKLQTSKFLYGCAVNALVLNVKWLADSIAADSVVPPEKYIILPNQAVLQYTRFRKSYNHDNSKRIFDGVGIMLHGKHSFCTKLTTIIKGLLVSHDKRMSWKGQKLRCIPIHMKCPNTSS
ncbi:uncharacterized protein LOC105631645 isoform X2 [Jatropha curcas]|uniref:uncharacterized protein LOC105631645 isoform X2 n=1 Tax=Jatropha curcas TaxID=180498 RepID=UPI0009D688D3|nr:uncharacterized protein LOC105631645 isoform X2 [Jatropha curcas]